MVFGSGQLKDQIILQTNSLKPFMGVCGFYLSVKFSTSLLALLTGGFNEDYIAVLALGPGPAGHFPKK